MHHTAEAIPIQYVFRYFPLFLTFVTSFFGSHTPNVFTVLMQSISRLHLSLERKQMSLSIALTEATLLLGFGSHWAQQPLTSSETSHLILKTSRKNIS
jgi:hypothetical protein